jgi:hypothetical protein
MAKLVIAILSIIDKVVALWYDRDLSWRAGLMLATRLLVSLSLFCLAKQHC